ncbi:MAG: hypothetical protein U5K43_03930 [Halofilum sp. (in: g-proteobacteria)]|nr:hypothetical protein [Halofilum sp. (in: g-proteobacteria)]
MLMLTARMLGRETIWATLFYATAVPALITGTMMPWFWETPSLAHVPWLIGSGFFGGLAMTLITHGFRMGSPRWWRVRLAGLVDNPLFGWLIWGELPALASVAGGLLIAACGAYLAWSQARAGRRRGTPEALRPPRGDCERGAAQPAWC